MTVPLAVPHLGGNEARYVQEIARRHSHAADAEYRHRDTNPRSSRVNLGKINRTLAFGARHTVQASIPLLVQALRDGVFLRADRDPQRFRQLRAALPGARNYRTAPYRHLTGPRQQGRRDRCCL